MQHPEPLRLQAYFDGELDAFSAADIERHIEQCAACHIGLQELEQTRAAIHRDSSNFRAPPELRARLTHALDQESAQDTSPPNGRGRMTRSLRQFWLGAVSGSVATAMAAMLAFALLAPPLPTPLLDGLMGAHLRSLMSTHLVDVVSTDKHTVKPWLAAHADASPVVADFGPEGYSLVGGRTDYVDRRRAAVTVYQHGQHIINVFSWAADQQSLPKNSTRNGYHLAFWQTGDLKYCAVSDTNWDELRGLVRLMQGLGATEE